MKGTALLVCLFAVSGVAQAQPAPAGGAANPAGARPAAAGRAPRYVEPVPYAFNDHAGWQPMFDGKTLKGWEGPMDVWRVENGAIVSSSTAANPNGSVYLYWGGGDLKDFEFKTEIKLEGEGANSGVQFRAQMLGKTEKKNSEWESIGYQADYDYVNTQTGALIECCAGPRRGRPPRPFKASMGQVIRVTDDDLKPVLLGSTGDPAALKASVHVGDWNELHIVVRGRFMLYFLNGRLMSEVIEDSSKLMDHGRLAIQLEGRGDTKVSYRNLWLKTLP